MSLRDFELICYYVILALSALSCGVQSRVVRRARRETRLVKQGSPILTEPPPAILYLAMTTYLTECYRLAMHLSLFVILGLPLVLSWLPTVQSGLLKLGLFLVEAIGLLLLPVLLLLTTYTTVRRKKHTLELLGK